MQQQLLRLSYTLALWNTTFKRDLTTGIVDDDATMVFLYSARGSMKRIEDRSYGIIYTAKMRTGIFKENLPNGGKLEP